MAERSPLLPFPAWVLALDVLGSLMLGAGIFLHFGGPQAAAPSLPAGADLLLLVAGGAAVAAGAVLMGRYARAASKPSR